MRSRRTAAMGRAAGAAILLAPGCAPREEPLPEELQRAAAGVDAAAAGWSHNIPAIREFMQRTCVAYFSTVPEFAEFILR